jgi:hypothetical protein|tara:strand:+ start:17686 stop:17955 length:270 start_codon:yes stop_codon:yes gene_type:complete
MAAEVVVGETPNTKEDGEQDEADELEGLAADGVNSGNGEPVAWNGASANQDAVSCGKVVELVVDSCAATVPNGLEDSSGIQTETIESNL